MNWKSWPDFEAEAKEKSQGWRTEVLAARNGEYGIGVDDQTYHALNLKYRLPSLFIRIKSFASAAAQAAATGLEVRGGEETEHVFSVCASCPQLIVDRWVCAQCGCHLEYKTAFREFRCPLGKW